MICVPTPQICLYDCTKELLLFSDTLTWLNTEHNKKLLWNFTVTGFQFTGTDAVFINLQSAGAKIVPMPLTPYLVDKVFERWEYEHLEVLKLEKGSSNLELHDSLFTGSPNFSSTK